MEEIKKIQVLPAQEEDSVALYQCFGWTFVSSQEINNSDSHLERRGDTIYNVTTKTNYVNLVFKRDTNMPNYQELVALEEKYWEVPVDRQPEMKSGNASAFLIVVGVISFIAGLIIKGVGGKIIGILLGVAAIVGGILLTVKRKKQFKQACDEYFKQDQTHNEERTQIAQEAMALVK